MVTRERTGRLVTLLPSLSAFDRGSATVHAAEETATPYVIEGTAYSIEYPELTALCGVRGWGAADRNLAEVSCGRCRRTARFRQVVPATPVVGAEPAVTPHDRGEV